MAIPPKETKEESVPVAQEKSVVKKVAPVVNKMAKGIEKPGNVSFVEAENTTVDSVEMEGEKIKETVAPEVRK